MAAVDNYSWKAVSAKSGQQITDFAKFSTRAGNEKAKCLVFAAIWSYVILWVGRQD